MAGSEVALGAAPVAPQAPSPEPEDAAPYAWTRETSQDQVHPVAQKKPNAWGLHDVIGTNGPKDGMRRPTSTNQPIQDLPMR